MAVHKTLTRVTASEGDGTSLFCHQKKHWFSPTQHMNQHQEKDVSPSSSESLPALPALLQDGCRGCSVALDTLQACYASKSVVQIRPRVFYEL